MNDRDRPRRFGKGGPGGPNGPTGPGGPRGERPDRGPRGRGPGPGGDRRDSRPPRQQGPRPPRREDHRDSRREERPEGARPHLSKDELRYHGRNACLALLQARGSDIIRAYVREDLAESFAPLLEFCAQSRRAYHLVDAGDLERLTDSVHHEGVCVVARARQPLAEKDFFRELASGRSLVLYTDGVGNPHNLGAILRTAAHFGFKYVAGPEEALPRLSPALCRVAEGAAELVSLVPVEEPESFLDRLKGQGYQVYAFDNKPGAISLYDLRLSEKAVFVVGAEVEGVSNLLRANADVTAKIPGSGSIESLNVSVAAALAMAEFYRQGNVRTVRIVKSPS